MTDSSFINQPVKTQQPLSTKTKWIIGGAIFVAFVGGCTVGSVNNYQASMPASTVTIQAPASTITSTVTAKTDNARVAQLKKLWPLMSVESKTQLKQAWATANGDPSLEMQLADAFAKGYGNGLTAEEANEFIHWAVQQ